MFSFDESALVSVTKVLNKNSSEFIQYVNGWPAGRRPIDTENVMFGPNCSFADCSQIFDTDSNQMLDEAGISRPQADDSDLVEISPPSSDAYDFWLGGPVTAIYDADFNLTWLSPRVYEVARTGVPVWGLSVYNVPVSIDPLADSVRYKILANAGCNRDLRNELAVVNRIYLKGKTAHKNNRIPTEQLSDYYLMWKPAIDFACECIGFPNLPQIKHSSNYAAFAVASYRMPRSTLIEAGKLLTRTADMQDWEDEAEYLLALHDSLVAGYRKSEIIFNMTLAALANYIGMEFFTYPTEDEQKRLWNSIQAA